MRSLCAAIAATVCLLALAARAQEGAQTPPPPPPDTGASPAQEPSQPAQQPAQQPADQQGASDAAPPPADTRPDTTAEAAPGAAAEGDAPAHCAPRKSAGEEREVEGTVRGRRGLVLALEPKGRDETVQFVILDEKCIRVDEAGNRGSLAQVAEGDQVRASFRVDGAQRIATQIEIVQKKAPKK
jgi:hypothetical protein